MISEITDQDLQTNSDGEAYVIAPPNKGMCGDGIDQSGETRSGCPEDLGLPNKVQYLTKFGTDTAPQPQTTTVVDAREP